MKTKKRIWMDVVVALTALLLAAGGIVTGYFAVAGGALAVWLGYALLRRIAARRVPQTEQDQPSEEAPVVVPVAKPRQRRPRPAVGNDPSSLINEMLWQGRYALLLRSQIVKNLAPGQLADATEALSQAMSLVPQGDVVLEAGRREADYRTDRPEPADIVKSVEGYYLDRHPVTNAEFQQFVDAGAYEQIPLWDPEILPAVLGFVDRTGQAGPRFWENGCFGEGLDDHPLVGISWYEATAYAGWVGKRLPNNSQWIKAGSWPVANATDKPTQRNYPWGDEMERQRANLWGSGPGSIVAVDQFESGASVGGILQLIGNVWEWTQNSFYALNHGIRELEFDEPMKSIRGGAFDTYFDNQATCQFQSGDRAMARKHNIGFRCALAVAEMDPIVLYGSCQDDDQSEPTEPTKPTEQADAAPSDGAPMAEVTQ